MLHPHQKYLLPLSYALTTAWRGTSSSHSHAENKLIKIHVTIADIYSNPQTSLVINLCKQHLVREGKVMPHFCYMPLSTWCWRAKPGCWSNPTEVQSLDVRAIQLKCKQDNISQVTWFNDKCQFHMTLIFKPRHRGERQLLSYVYINK